MDKPNKCSGCASLTDFRGGRRPGLDAAERTEFFAGDLSPAEQGATVTEVTSSHVPMLSQPAVVIDVIRKAVAALQAA